jgi:hypothetical protein
LVGSSCLGERLTAGELSMKKCLIYRQTGSCAVPQFPIVSAPASCGRLLSFGQFVKFRIQSVELMGQP